MKTAPALFRIFIVCFALSALGWWALRLRDEVARKDKLLNDLRRMHDSTVTELVKSRLDLTSLEENVARLKRERDQGRANVHGKVPGESVPDGESPDGSQRADISGGWGKLAGSPDMSTMIRSQMAARTRKAYASLLKKWNLAPSDLELVVGLIPEQSMGVADYAMSHGQGKQLQPDELIAAVKKTTEEASEKLKSVLGEERFEELGAFNREMKIESVVSPYSDHLEVAGFPLSQEQKVNLADIITSESARRADELVPDKSGRFSTEALRTRNEARQTRIIQKAAAFLTPDQISGLQSIFREQNEAQESAGKMIDALLKSSDGEDASKGAGNAP